MLGFAPLSATPLADTGESYSTGAPALGASVNVIALGQPGLATEITVTDPTGQPELFSSVNVIALGRPGLATEVEVFQIIGIGQPSITLWAFVDAFGVPALPARISVLSAEERTNRPILRASVNVVALGAPTLGAEVIVAWPTGAPRLEPEIQVRAAGAPALASAVHVRQGRYLSRWRPVVRLGGVDVSARITGQIRVEAEEGAARVAEFSIVPFAGALDPLAWNGQTVEIDVAAVHAGGETLHRLFTGRVDVPEYDAHARLVTLACSDDLQHRVARLGRAEIDTLINGKAHPAVHGDYAGMTRWEYAQAQIGTLEAHFGADRHGNLWMVPWRDLQKGLGFGTADVLTGTVGLELPRRAELVNTVTAELDWRYARLYLWRVLVSYRHDIQLTLKHFVAPPLEEDILDEDGEGDWKVVVNGITRPRSFYNLFSPNPGGISLPAADQMIEACSLSYELHFVQTITDRYSLTVTAPASIEANGELADEIRGAWGSEFDAQAWEENPQSPAVSLAAPYGEAWLDHAPDAPAGGAAWAVESLLATARSTILGSHRKGRIILACPCLPEIDHDWAVSLTTSEITGSGKAAEITHILDCDTGSATTEIRVAISGVGGTGIVVVDTPLTAPAAPEPEAAVAPPTFRKDLATHMGADRSSEPYSEEMEGWIVNQPAGSELDYTQSTIGPLAGQTISAVNMHYYPDNEYPFQGWRLNLPGVDAARRDPGEQPAAQDYQVAIPEDPIAIAA